MLGARERFKLAGSFCLTCVCFGMSGNEALLCGHPSVLSVHRITRVLRKDED